MKRFRVVLVFLLSAVIVFGIWKYYTVNQNVYFQDPVSPLWERLTTTLELDPQPEQLSATGEKRPSLLTRLFSGKYTPKFSRTDQSDQLHTDLVTGRIAMADVLDIRESGIVAGAVDGRILILEYCHFDSQYCQEAAADNVVDDYLSAASGQVQYSFRSYPPTMRRTALLPHIALSCVANQGTENQYLTYLQRLYKLDVYNQETLVDLANQLQVDQFASCLDQNRYALLIRQQMKQADQLFAINALPTYIILDRNTGKFIKVPGLYETKEVNVAVKKLLE